MSEKILKIEDVLQDNSKVVDKKSKKKGKSKRKKINVDVTRGAFKSGRTWKTKKNRFSSIIKTPGYKKANKFEKLQALKKDLKRVRNLTREIVEKRQQQIEAKKERRRENLRRQEENRKKSEIVQVIKNSAKIKRMRKKQLRMIEKRDTLNK